MKPERVETAGQLYLFGQQNTTNPKTGGGLVFFYTVART